MERFTKHRLLVIEFDRQIRGADIDWPYGEIVKEEGNKLWMQFDRERVSAFDLIGSLERDKGIIDVSIQEENIESIVTRIYENGLQGC